MHLHQHVGVGQHRTAAAGGLAGHHSSFSGMVQQQHGGGGGRQHFQRPQGLHESTDHVLGAAGESG